MPSLQKRKHLPTLEVGGGIHQRVKIHGPMNNIEFMVLSQVQSFQAIIFS
jgi:hypothetical protein